jgi:TPP-dependent pyruvate/acetoin dehydrogenase alpha subunit
MSVETAASVAEPDLRDDDVDDLGLRRADYRRLYHTMRLQREFEERIYRLFRQGRLTGAAYAGAGHEAIAAGSAYALAPRDVLVPMHRVIGAHFLRGHSPRDMMCQYYGRANGPTRGRDGNMHCGTWSKRIVGMTSHLGANVPVAAGIALASRIRGEDIVALTFIGEGGTSIGDFHEGLNFAAVHKLPMVLIIENNKYAYSTPARLEYACENLVDRAPGYGIEGVLIDGTDVRAVYRAAKTAVDRARAGEGPTLIEAKCTRLLGHAQHDNPSYVPKEVLEEGWRNDPVKKCGQMLVDLGYFSREEIETLNAEIVQEVDDAVTYAENSPLPAPEEALEGVYAE